MATVTYDFEAVLNSFLSVWSDGMLLSDLAERLTCTEAEVLADLLRATGRPAAAEHLIDAHSYGDEEGDLHYGG